RVLIQMDEKFVVPGGAPGKAGDKGKKSAGKGSEQPASAQIPAAPPGYPGNGWQQAPGQGIQPAADSFADKTRQVEAPAIKAPVMKTEPGWSSPPPVKVAPPAAAQSQLSVPLGPTPVPSCVKVGKRIENFAL